jgi:tetratricopeptide (TPR) repeat protein
MKKYITAMTILFLSLSSIAYALDDAAIYDAKGREFERSGMYDAALQEYEKAIALDSSYSNALFNAGRMYFLKKEFQKAIDTFNRVVILKPNDGEAYFFIGGAYEALDKYSDAIKNNDKALELKYPRAIEQAKHLEPYSYKEINFEYIPILTKQKEKVFLRIKGNPIGSRELISDILNKIEILAGTSRKGMFNIVNVEFIRWESEYICFEKWTVSINDEQHDYMVKLTKTPQQGGTDILISEMNSK